MHCKPAESANFQLCYFLSYPVGVRDVDSTWTVNIPLWCTYAKLIEHANKSWRTWVSTTLRVELSTLNEGRGRYLPSNNSSTVEQPWFSFVWIHIDGIAVFGGKIPPRSACSLCLSIHFTWKEWNLVKIELPGNRPSCHWGKFHNEAFKTGFTPLYSQGNEFRRKFIKV